MKNLKRKPHAARDLAVVPDAHELVGRGDHVQVGGLLVGEERVRHPHVTQVLGAHRQPLDAALLLEREPRVVPVLPEVHVQREVLE